MERLAARPEGSHRQAGHIRRPLVDRPRADGVAIGRIEGQKRGAEEFGREIKARASAGAAKYLPLIREAKDGTWIDGFLAFRDDFEFADDAHDTIAAFAELRAKHVEPAKKALN